MGNVVKKIIAYVGKRRKKNNSVCGKRRKKIIAYVGNVVKKIIAYVGNVVYTHQMTSRLSIQSATTK